MRRSAERHLATASWAQRVLGRRPLRSQPVCPTTSPGDEPTLDLVNGAHRTVRPVAGSMMKRNLQRKRDQLATRSTWIASGLETFGHDRRVAGSLLAAGVAFRLFLMMLPLALLSAAALGFASSEPRPASSADVARQYGLTLALASTIASSAGDSSRGRWILLGTGLVLLLWAGRGVAQAISRAFALAWGTEPARGRAAVAMTLTVIGGFL